MRKDFFEIIENIFKLQKVLRQAQYKLQTHQSKSVWNIQFVILKESQRLDWLRRTTSLGLGVEGGKAAIKI